MNGKGARTSGAFFICVKGHNKISLRTDEWRILGYFEAVIYEDKINFISGQIKLEFFKTIVSYLNKFFEKN